MAPAEPGELHRSPLPTARVRRQPFCVRPRSSRESALTHSLIANAIAFSRLSELEKKLDALASGAVSHAEPMKVAELADDAMSKARRAEDTAENQQHTTFRDALSHDVLTLQQARARGYMVGVFDTAR